MNAVYVAVPNFGSFLVDSGSDLSLLPASYADTTTDSSSSQHISMTAANGSSISSYGTKLITFDIQSLRQSFSWTFTVAEVNQPILGYDFLQHYGLVIDCRRGTLRRSTTVNAVSASQAGASKLVQRKSAQIKLAQNKAGVQTFSLKQPTVKDLEQRFPVVFKAPAADDPVLHPVKHHIVTSGPPTFARPRPLFGEKLKIAKQVFDKLERQGVIFRGESPWATPLHMAPKSDPKCPWRPCGDFRQLNKQTVPDRYPMPNIPAITNGLHGCTVFSKLDLVSAFHQIPVAAEDQPKTAVTTPFGLFIFRMMPFGLRNASQTFQRLMDMALHDLPFAQSYIDDLLVASKCHSEHIQHVQQVLKRLEEFGMHVNARKCEFFRDSVVYVGMNISAQGIEPVKGKVDEIRNFPRPTTIQGLRRFLGMAGFYHRNVPHFSEVAAPLTDLTRNHKKGSSTDIKWTEVSNKAFDDLKSSLHAAFRLNFPHPQAKLELTTDASGTAIGAVLHQMVNGERQPLAFYSAKLKPNESKKSAFDRELLAIYRSLKHFDWLLGSQFIIRTDHKPLVNCLGMKNPTPQQTRWLSYIAEFSASIIHVSGSDNVVADALSRTVGAVQINFDEELADSQTSDHDLSAFVLQTKLPISTRQVGKNKFVWYDETTGRQRPYLPQNLRYNVFKERHGWCHPGTKKTLKLVADDFIWPSMNKDVRQWTRACQSCQSSKVLRHTKPAIKTIPTVARFHTVHIDLVGPLPVSKNCRYLVTMVDRFTRWMEAVPVQSMDTDTVAAAFVQSWVSRFGVPEVVISDRGRQFESTLWSKLMTRFGIKRRRTTAYHPACNGAVERFHRTLKNALRTQCNAYDWHDNLPVVLLGLRATVNTSGYSPFELVYGSKATLPGSFFQDSSKYISQSINDFADRLFEKVASFRIPPRKYSDVHFVPKELSSSTHVWLRREGMQSSLDTKYTGPYRLLKLNDKTATIALQDREEVVTLERVKPAFFCSPEHSGGTQRLPSSTTDVQRQSNKEKQRQSNKEKQSNKEGQSIKDKESQRMTKNDGRLTASDVPPAAPAHQLPVGSVVLVKQRNQPWWPALLVDPLEHSVQLRPRTPDTRCVQFFNESNLYALVEPDQVMHLQNDYTTKHAGAAKALRLARQFIQQQSSHRRPHSVKRQVRFNLEPTFYYLQPQFPQRSASRKGGHVRIHDCNLTYDNSCNIK